MKCLYSLTMKASCPADELPDVYNVLLESATAIPVEDILATVKKHEGMRVFQEEITASLARQLCCTVRTVGYHSGVKTEVVCP